MRRIASLFVALFAAGCSPVTILNSVSGSDMVREQRDLSYGPLERHAYDLYEPANAGVDAPLILFVHGGSWMEGSKDIYRFLGTALGDAGYPVAVVNYRLSPGTVFPGFVEDAALAADHFLKGDRPVVLMGHSAGAHIAALLAYDPRYMQAVGRSNCDFAGFVGISGPYDFLPLTQETHRVTFPEATRDDSQPINFAQGPKPPSLLLATRWRSASTKGSAISTSSPPCRATAICGVPRLPSPTSQPGWTRAERQGASEIASSTS